MYNFETEWKIACLARAASGHVSLCPGIRDHVFSSLFGMACPGGHASVYNLESGVFPVLSLLWDSQRHSRKPVEFCKEYDVFSYITDAESVRSAFCSYKTGCPACTALAGDLSLRRRAHRAFLRTEESIDMQRARLMTGVTSHMSTAELLLHTEDRRQIGQDDYQMRATTKLSKQRVLEKLAK